MNVPPLVTPRLLLASLDASAIESLLRGDEAAAGRRLGVSIPDDLGAASEGLLRIRLNDLRRRPDAQAWLLRVIAERAGGAMVGFIGFHGPPDAVGRVEIGYEVLPECRRRGYALEATRGMLEWAREHGARRFRASIRPDNAASRGLAERLGFRRAGSRWNPVDQTELIYELEADAVAGWSLPPRARG